MAELTVVGGGITGIAAALEASSRDGVDVRLVEASDRLGGKIKTSTFRGRQLDEGADAFLRRVPEGIELCEEVGLRTTSPASGHASILIDDDLRRIPGGLVLGVPARFDELEGAGILSAEGLLRARREAELPGMPISGDTDIEEFISQRYGPEVSTRLVEPLIGGIYGGVTRRLSLDAVLPQLSAIAHAEQSCTDALGRQLDSAQSGEPVFGAPLSGMEELINRCSDLLVRRGVEIVLGEPLSRIDSSSPTVIATAGPGTGRLVQTASPTAARLIDSIDWAGVVLIALALDRGDFPSPPDGSGFLVPRDSGYSMTAVSWSSNKWSHLDTTDGEVIARASLGHVGDQAPMGWSDERVLETVGAELQRIVGLSAEPLESRITRYPDGFPQYDVGHSLLADRIDEAMDHDAPNTAVTGSAHRGLGIPACIRQGRAAVTKLLGDPPSP